MNKLIILTIIAIITLSSFVSGLSFYVNYKGLISPLSVNFSKISPNELDSLIVKNINFNN